MSGLEIKLKNLLGRYTQQWHSWQVGGKVASDTREPKYQPYISPCLRNENQDKKQCKKILQRPNVERSWPNS